MDDWIFLINLIILVQAKPEPEFLNILDTRQSVQNGFIPGICDSGFKVLGLGSNFGTYLHGLHMLVVSLTKAP